MWGCCWCGQTRIQNQNFESKAGGLVVIKDIMKNEGPSAFFKGLTPKVRPLVHFPTLPPGWMTDCRFASFVSQVLVVGPKLIFAYTMAQSLIPFFASLGV